LHLLLKVHGLYCFIFLRENGPEYLLWRKIVDFKYTTQEPNISIVLSWMIHPFGRVCLQGSKDGVFLEDRRW
jgi:hypothetical protein